MLQRTIISLTLCLLLLVGVSAVAADGPTANLTDGCVEDFDPAADYFPAKADLGHAAAFNIDYFNNYKVITVNTPWTGATEDDVFQYVLVQCGTPAPDAAGFNANAQFIEVPAGDIVAMSTTQLPQIVELGLLDHLIGMDSFLYTNTPEVIERIEAGDVIEVGTGPTANIEVLLDAEPSIVMPYSYGSPDWDTHPVLLDAGIFTAMNAEHVEATLLARAEWLKFMAAFYNKEALAEELFAAIEANYEAVAAIAAEIPAEERATVLWNAYNPYSESWIIPGGNTWVGGLLMDANVNYVLQEEAVEGAQYLDFEAVYDAGLEAPVWVVNSFGVNTINEFQAMDERYADFAAFQTGAVYNDNAQVNENGGSAYWESGMTHPDLILSDLVALFYPDLMPDHEFSFYKQLTAAE